MTKDESRAGLEALRNQLLASGVPCAALGAFEDEIRAEAADRGVKKFTDMVKSPNQRDIPTFKSFRDDQAAQLRSAIIGGKE